MWLKRHTSYKGLGTVHYSIESYARNDGTIQLFWMRWSARVQYVVRCRATVPAPVRQLAAPQCRRVRPAHQTAKDSYGKLDTVEYLDTVSNDNNDSTLRCGYRTAPKYRNPTIVYRIPSIQPYHGSLLLPLLQLPSHVAYLPIRAPAHAIDLALHLQCVPLSLHPSRCPTFAPPLTMSRFRPTPHNDPLSIHPSP